MAHFAQLNENGTVIQVIVVSNDALGGLDFPESEPVGIEFCRSLFGEETVWKQTSYNGNFRKNYAGVGFTFDAERDAFIPPKPFASWVLNDGSCSWEPPIAMPDDGDTYWWHEETQSWNKVVDL